jgi:phage gpG-like protein
MMPGIEIASQNVVIAYGRLGVRTQQMAHRVVREFGLDVTAASKRNAPVKTGKLRRSINGKYTSGTGFESGVVGPNVEYARIVEEGFHGTENVKAFFRMQTKAWGRDIAPKQVQVRAHAREVNRPAKPYLVPGFESVTPLSDRLRAGMAALGLQ